MKRLTPFNNFADVGELRRRARALLGGPADSWRHTWPTGAAVRTQNVRRYIIFDVRQIRFNLILYRRHAMLNMHNLWAHLEFYYYNPLYFSLLYTVTNFISCLYSKSICKYGWSLCACFISYSSIPISITVIRLCKRFCA